ncbi:MAG: nucleotidyltransferase domain-containing protein [Candidatus Caldarchaeales archaeon]
MQKKYSNSVKIYYPRYGIEEINEKIKTAKAELCKLGVVKIILFGSFAKRRATASSDVDLLVLVKDRESKNNFHEIAKAIDIEIAEIHLYTIKDFEELRSRGSWLSREVDRYGIKILDLQDEEHLE